MNDIAYCYEYDKTSVVLKRRTIPWFINNYCGLFQGTITNIYEIEMRTYY